MKLALSIALRFLLSSRGQSLLIALGIAVGIAVQVFIGSLIAGLQVSLIDTTIGSTPHITVTSRTDDGLLRGYQDSLEYLQTREGIQGVIPTITQPAFTILDGSFETVVVRGLPLPAADTIYSITPSLIEGQWETGQILIGGALADQGDFTVGDTLTLLTGAGDRNEGQISGLFDLQVSSLNRTWVIGDMATVQGWFGLEEGITSIEMQIDDVFAADTLSLALKEELGQDALAFSHWKEENEQLLTGLQGQSASSLMIQVFVVIAVSLGIASVLAVTVIQKAKQIGILKAMGIRDGQASWVFIFQGLLLGTLGGILGIGLGLSLTYIFATFVVNPDGTPVVALLIEPPFVLGSGLVAILAGLLAALIPARKSQKLDPMEVIRSG